MTLTEFLLARIAEDEAIAREAAEHRTSVATHSELGLHLSSDGPAGMRWTRRYDTVNATREDGGRAGGIAYVGNFGMGLVAHIARHDPARVLAECAAKRRIVAGYATYASQDDPADQAVGRTVFTALRFLAAVHADHPDYRDEWRP